MKKETFDTLTPVYNIKHNTRWLIMICFGIISLILAGCNDSSDSSNDSDNNGTNELNITVLDDPLTDNPLAGTYVSPYNSDKQSISRTITTGADGIANFGDVSSSITVTIAYEDNGQKAREIPTIYDAKPGNYTVFMKDIGCASQNSINAA